MTIQCAHAKCIHRTDNMQCGLALQGKVILLNVVGQCEMVETKDHDRVPVINNEAVKCSRFGCSQNAIFICTDCGSYVCENHEKDYLVGHDDEGKMIFAPYCNICFQRRLVGDASHRDDRDDPDDPWQMLEGAF